MKRGQKNQTDGTSWIRNDNTPFEFLNNSIKFDKFTTFFDK